MTLSYTWTSEEPGHVNLEGGAQISERISSGLQLLRPLSDIESVGEDASRFLVAGGAVTLPLGEVSILYGDSGIGKSFLAYQLAVCVAAGRDFLGGSSMYGPVVILDFENKAAEVADRLRATAEALGVSEEASSSVHLCALGATGETLHEKVGDVVDELNVLQPVLVVVDGWQGAFGGDSTKTDQVDAAFRVLRRVAAGTRSVLVLHHISSAQVEKAQPNTGGNRYIQHFARCVYLMSDAGSGSVKLKPTKENYGIERNWRPLIKMETARGLFFLTPDNAPFTVRLPNETARTRKTAIPEAVKFEDLVMEIVVGAGGSCLESELFKQAAKRSGFSYRYMRERLRPVIDAFAEDGRLSREKARNNTHRLSVRRGLEAVPTSSNRRAPS